VQAWSTPSAGEFKKMGKARIGNYRFQLSWESVEPVRGQRLWGGPDSVVERAARARVALLPLLLGSPSFAAAKPQSPPTGSAAAKAGWSQFVRDAVARYGPNGVFWKQNPSVPKRPIRNWQVWNEPSFPAYWFGQPSAAEYVDFLRLTRGALKSRDGGAKVVLAGIPESRFPGAIGMERYIRRVYQAGGRSAFDVLALHPYARNEKECSAG